MNLVIATFLEVLGLAKRNKKWIYALFVFFLWLILCGKSISGDRVLYKLYYETIEYVDVNNHEIEVGFQLSMLIAKKLHFTFYMYLAVYSLIAYSLISYTVIKFSRNPALVMCLYFFYPFILDAEQLRSFMGMAIMLFGISFLAQHTIRGTVIYIVLCIIATLFHSTCCVFIAFALVIFPTEIIRYIVAVVCIIVVWFQNIIINFAQSFSFISRRKIETYMDDINSEKGIYSVTFFLVIFLLIMFLVKKQQKIETENKIKSFNMDIYKVNAISIMFLFFVYINDNFTRLPRAILLLDYIVVSNSVKRKITKWHEVAILMVALSVTGIRFVSYIVGSGWNRLMIPFFFDGFHLF